MGCLTVLLIIVIVLILVKVFFKLSTRWDRSATCLLEKTAIVTGANTGKGFYIAQDFAKRGARVILACRDRDRAIKNREKIIEASGNYNVVIRIVDFTSLKSVREFARAINITEKRLDILVNNPCAGILEDTTTNDGLNTLMQIKYFAPFLLTLLLIDLLKESAPSRIVNVSSAASHCAKLDPNYPDRFPKGILSQGINYANAKLCNILFTNELARKLKGSGVVVNSLHPGTANSRIGRNWPAIFRIIVRSIVNVVFQTSEECAQTVIYVSVSKEIEGITGEYFDNCKIPWFPGMPRAARDEGLAKKVWEKSEELVKLTEVERKI